MGINLLKDAKEMFCMANYDESKFNFSLSFLKALESNGTSLPLYGEQLQKKHDVKSILGTLSIEGNCLDEKKVASIMKGKMVISSPRDLLEVQNAIKAYEQIHSLNPILESDLKIAQGAFMSSIMSDNGEYRKGFVGIYSDSNLIYKAPDAKLVPKLMVELFQFIEDSDSSPLVMSSLFHYYLLWILPFSGGNGLVGRFWQKLILSKWHPAFLYLPFEELIFQDLEGYHRAIQESHNTNEPTPFVDYMLKILSLTVEKYL